MSQSLAECKARLASIQSYRRQFLMVTKATVTSSKTVDFSFRGPSAFKRGRCCCRSKTKPQMNWLSSQWAEISI